MTQSPVEPDQEARQRAASLALDHTFAEDRKYGSPELVSEDER